MFQCNARPEKDVSLLMRCIASGVLVVYTTVVVSPGVQAAQQVVEGVVNDAKARERDAQETHAHVMEEAIADLRALKSKRAQSTPIAQLEEERRDLLELGQKLKEENEKAQQEFESFEDRLNAWHVPEVIMQRHHDAIARLQEESARSENELRGIAEAPNARVLDERVDGLLTRLSSLRTRKPHQRFDASQMPYRPASGKSRAPKTSTEDLIGLFAPPAEPKVLLASTQPFWALPLGAASSVAVGPEYLSETEDVQITQEIRDIAAQLGKNPVSIYNWVRNNIQYLPTYGSIQGSHLTLLNGRGNAYDTSSLLIALLRAAEIPARYAYGTVEVPIEKVMNWVGVSTADQAQDLIGQGGIPNVAVTSGGRIKSLRFEHVWVEAWVDFVPSRGAKNVTGDTWVPLDASFKHYIVESGVNPADSVPLDAAGMLATLKASSTIDDQTGVVSAIDVVQFKSAFRGYESQFVEALEQAKPGITSLELLDRRYIEVREDPVLPSGLPYKKVAAGNTYASLPASLRHYVRVSLYSNALDRSEDFPRLSHSISLPSIGLRRLWVDYRPASSNDAAVIDSAVSSGATSLPAYLIRVVPQLKLDDTVLAQGPSVTMGEAQYWQARLSGPIPASNAEVPFDHTVAGDLLVLSVDGAGIVGSAAGIRRGQSWLPNAAEDLHFAGLSYWTAHNWTDRFTAEGLGGRIVRLPSVALLSAGFTPRYYFGIARQASYQGRVLDARRVSIAAVAPSNQIRRAIVTLAGIQGSQWEATTLNSVFGRRERTAMSASEYMAYATTHGVPIQIVAPDNLSTALANLQISADVESDIAAAVQAGNIAMVPQRDLNVRGRIGNGYVILDPETGAGAYLIDGGLNGGFECPCGGPFAAPPAASAQGPGGGGIAFSGGPALLAMAAAAPAALPALAEVASTVPNIIQSEAALVRVAEIGAQAANSPFFNQARALAPRMASPVAFRLMAGGFVLSVGAIALTSVIFATAYSIAVLFTYHMAQIELALLAAEGGGAATLYPEAPPSAEPNPDEDECKCDKNPQLPECQCVMTRKGAAGGHFAHNQCANEYNYIKNQDVCWFSPRLKMQRCYDAGADEEGRLVYEVKVNRFSSYNDFLKRKTVEKNTTQAIMQELLALDCHLFLTWVTKDPAHAAALNGSAAFPSKPVIPNETCGDAADTDLPPEDVPTFP